MTPGLNAPGLNAPGLDAPQEALQEEGPNLRSPNSLEPPGEQLPNAQLAELLAALNSLPRDFIPSVLALSELTRTSPTEEKTGNQTSIMPMNKVFEKNLQMQAISATTSGFDPSGSQEFLARLIRQERMEAFPGRDLAPFQEHVSEPPRDRAPHMTLLHDVLADYMTCPMDTCVRLNNIDKSPEDDTVTIGMLLTYHPHERITEEQLNDHWRDTQIGLSTAAVTFHEQNAGHEGEEYEEVNRQLDHQDALCKRISGYPQTFMSLLVRRSRKDNKQEHKLMIGKLDQPTNKIWETRQPSISLVDLLKGTVGTSLLSHSMKHSLSIRLAKAVWECYKTPWMREPWTSHEVHFVLETRTKTWGNEPGLFVDEPLLASSIPRPQFPTTSPKTSPERPTHLIPKILALGIMLMEIWLGHPIEDERSINGSYPKSDGEKHMHCWNIISRDEKKFHGLEIPPSLQQLIKSCIVDWRDDFPKPGSKKSDDEIRDRLGILVFKAMYHLDDISKPVPIRTSRWRSHSTDHLIGKPAGPPARGGLVPLHGSVITDIQQARGMTMNHQTSKVSSHGWFSKTTKVINILKPLPNEAGLHIKVKVAVLDTGIHKIDSDNFLIYKDFVKNTVNGTPSHVDRSGHGTTSIRLISRMCDSAEIFALRVFENDTAGSEAVDSVVEALDWCIKNDIEIVCMALGFESDETDRLLKIVKKASERMLIIAAPTNKGNLENIRFPARYNSYVLPMYSSSGYVRGSDFNPSTEPGPKLAMLGEDISAIEVGSGNACGLPYNSVTKSGTSYSTALAVGFAARLADFARHSDVKSILRDQAHKLIDKSSMKQFLCKLANEEKGSSFYCIKPWDLLPGEMPAHVELSSTERLHARQVIARKIEFILLECRPGVSI